MFCLHFAAQNPPLKQRQFTRVLSESASLTPHKDKLSRQLFSQLSAAHITQLQNKRKQQEKVCLVGALSQDVGSQAGSPQQQLSDSHVPGLSPAALQVRLQARAGP